MIRAIAALGMIAVTLVLAAEAQVPTEMNGKLSGSILGARTPDIEVAVNQSERYRSLKRPGHYTAQDWRALIDSLWGPGPSTAAKLQVFDFFWDLIDKNYAGFPNLAANWDSLKAVYRPEVEAGVSRGRFWGIMGRMYMSLQEIHTWMSDLDLDAYFKEGGRLVYKPGIPAFFVSGWGWAGSFGAALTPLPDSSLLVYKALAGHPLGIMPGDIILGYDGIPWNQLYPELLTVEFPIEWWGETCHGSSPRSMTHGLLGSAGSNWGLFDTVDVVKYSTGDTVHLPTAPLASLDYLSLFATEQVAVPGVKMPDYAQGERITWGVVDGTSVGYIYAYCWDAAVGPVFESAVRDLVTVKKVTGLVLDFRYNVGSKDSWTAANAGLDYLFNEDPISPSRARTATRAMPNDHFGFSFSPPPGSFQPRPDYYDRPIAVLTGPQAWSLGDHVPFRMRSHPMVRSFGLPTNGAFVVGGPWETGPVFGNWYYRYAAGQLQSLVNNEGFLMHNTPPVDEEVWLTRDGVAKGEDDVVKAALAWMGKLAYAHDVHVAPLAPKINQDTVFIRATVENPQAHTLRVSALIDNLAGGALIDSIPMYNDGLHGDGLPNDSLWGAKYVPQQEAVYSVSIRTDDLPDGTFRILPKVGIFATAGPLKFAGYQFFNPSGDTVPNPGNTIMMYIGIKNHGSTAAVPNVVATLSALDTGYSAVYYGVPTAVASLAPDSVVFAFFVRLQFSTTRPAPYSAAFDVNISSDGVQFWTDTMRLDVLTGIKDERESIPATFALRQNYPNPSNPSTTIRYELPKSSMVRLNVYDILGREVSVLVNERKNAGVYEVMFDALGLSSGVYLYRLQAGDFVEVKKLIVVK